MNIPSLVLGLVIATLTGALFFAFRPSRSYRRLGYCILIAWIGFAAGHFIAEWTGLNLWTAGAINLGGALPGCLLGLIGWQILSLREWEK